MDSMEKVKSSAIARCFAELSATAQICQQEKCKTNRAPLAHFTLLPIKKDLGDLYSGENIFVATTCTCM